MGVIGWCVRANDGGIADPDRSSIKKILLVRANFRHHNDLGDGTDWNELRLNVDRDWARSIERCIGKAERVGVDRNAVDARSLDTNGSIERAQRTSPNFTLGQNAPPIEH